MNDQTRIIDDGTAIYPLDPAAAVADENCPHCQATIPAGDQFCLACGYQRGTWAEGGNGSEATAPDAVAVDARYTLVAGDGTRYPLPDGETVAGRSEGVDLIIPDGYISRRHARFAVDAQGVRLTDLGSANGTFIGAEKLVADEEHVLAIGAVFQLGQTELKLEAIEPVTETAPAEAETTQVMSPAADGVADRAEAGNEDGEKPALLTEAKVDVTAAASPWSLRRVGEDEVFYLPYGASELGRKPGKCDILVRGDGYISGKHARVLASMEQLEVIDLGSTNGTYVNSERAAPDHVVQLKAGDNLRLGQTDLTVVFEAVEEDAADEPVKVD